MLSKDANNQGTNELSAGVAAGFGALIIFVAAISGAIAMFAQHSLAIWLGWILCALAGFIGLDLLATIIPWRWPRTFLRTISYVGMEVLGLLITTFGTIYNVAFALGLVFLGYALVIAVAILLVGVAAPMTVIGYLAALGTIMTAAYGRDRVLLPIKGMYLISRGPDDSVAVQGIRTASTLIRRINFRRLAYQLAIIVYVASVVFRLSNLRLPGGWAGVRDVALEALLAFLALDAYIATFHPRLLKERKPLDMSVASTRFLWWPGRPGKG